MVNKTVRKFLSDIGKKAGNSTKAKYGREHYVRIGRQGAIKRWSKSPTLSITQ